MQNNYYYIDPCKRSCYPYCTPCYPFPPAPAAVLAGFQAQANNLAQTVIADNGVVIFNTVINASSANITYDQITGTFYLAANRNYYVSWWIDIDGVDGIQPPQFSIFVNGSNIVGVTPLVTTQLTGTALVTAVSPFTTLQLINRTGASVLLANVPVQANITIIEAL